MMKKVIGVLFIATLFLGLASCGGGKAKLSEKGLLLSSKAWKLQPQEMLDDAAKGIKDTTGISADIKLGGDIADLVNFAAETVIFGVDSKDASKLSYSRTVGEGLFSSEVLGWWEFNEGETAILMLENGTTAKVKYEIKELTADKLVLLKEGDVTPNIYRPK